MENLPFLVLDHLFKMMTNRNELIKCSQVCQNWRAAYQAIQKSDRLFLHFDPFIPLNHRLFYTNEPVTRFDFLQIRNDLRFLSSEIARSQFANIRKLIIFPAYRDHPHPPIYEFSFQKQLNNFRCLEHFEMHKKYPTLERQNFWLQDTEIDLPKLKILLLKWCDIAANVKIVLNTPSLEVFGLGNTDDSAAKIGHFKFRFPHKLKHLAINNPGDHFRLPARRFVNLECLIIDPAYNRYQTLGDHFLKRLPSLKFLFVFECEADYSELEAEKQELNRKDLLILDHVDDVFSYTDWHQYVQHRERLSYWPTKHFVKFNLLLECQIPQQHFEENFLQIGLFLVGQVTNQSLLVEFLRRVNIEILDLNYDFNLGQSFFDEIADFLTVKELVAYESSLNGLSDYSPLSRLNVCRIQFYFEQLQAPLASAILKSSSCVLIDFMQYAGSVEDEERGLCPLIILSSSHLIKKVKNQFYCQQCRWTSAKNCSKDPIEGTVLHIQRKKSEPNITEETYNRLFRSVHHEATSVLPDNL